MAAKPQFDMMILNFGYQAFVVPKAAALQFMELCSGSDVYKYDTSWSPTTNSREVFIRPLDDGEDIRLQHIGPVQFHQGLENWKMQQEEKRAKAAKTEAAKEAAKNGSGA
jgi:hypothetical protein